MGRNCPAAQAPTEKNCPPPCARERSAITRVLGSHTDSAHYANAHLGKRLQIAANTNQENTMNNVIAFPDKVFPQWGAIAQALSAYLLQLGATNAQSREIVVRLQARWEQLGVPPALPFLRLIPELRPGEQYEAGKAGLEGRSMQLSRHWKSENARTLLELARLEYGLSQAV